MNSMRLQMLICYWSLVAADTALAAAALALLEGSEISFHLEIGNEMHPLRDLNSQQQFKDRENIKRASFEGLSMILCVI